MSDAELEAIETRNQLRTQEPLRTYDRASSSELLAVGPVDGGHGIAAFLRAEDAGHFIHAQDDINTLLIEAGFLRRVLADMADDGKDVSTVMRYRKALERIQDDSGSAEHLAQLARETLQGAP